MLKEKTSKIVPQNEKVSATKKKGEEEENIPITYRIYNSNILSSINSEIDKRKI